VDNEQVVEEIAIHAPPVVGNDMLVHIDRDNEQTVEELVFHMPPDALNESINDHGESDSDIRTVS